MTVHIESIPMQKLLLKALKLAIFDCQYRYTVKKLHGIDTAFNENVNNRTQIQLQHHIQSLVYDIDNHRPFRTESPATIEMLINAIDLMLIYDQKDLAANHDLNDRIANEDIDTRINDLILLKHNLESTLQPA